MSRTYALSLIFTVLTFIGGAFYGQYRYLTNGQAETAAYAAGVHERVIAGQLQEIEEIVRKAGDRMQDESKARFRPILPFVEKALSERDIYLNQVEEEMSDTAFDMATFSRLHYIHLMKLSTRYGLFLQEFGHEMDLSEDDIETKVFNIEKMVSGFSYASTSASEAVLTPRLLSLDYLEVVRNVIRDVVEVSGGKVITCHFGPQHFPVFSMNVENPRKGEEVLAKIWAGSYSSELNPDNIIILIDKDTLSLNPDGTADYSFTPKNRGKLELDVELAIVNPLTGEVLRNETKKVFNIR